MKNIRWHFVMFATAILMTLGGAISLWAIYYDQTRLAIGGLIIMAAVCVSWWLWVMFIIRTMIKTSSRTQEGLSDIRQLVSEIKKILTRDK